MFYEDEKELNVQFQKIKEYFSRHLKKKCYSFKKVCGIYMF